MRNAKKIATDLLAEHAQAAPVAVIDLARKLGVEDPIITEQVAVLQMRCEAAKAIGRSFKQSKRSSGEDADEVDLDDEDQFPYYLLIPDDELISRLHLVSMLPKGEKFYRYFAQIFAVPVEMMKERFEIFRLENPRQWQKYNLSAKLEE
jgi:hypothetical protein